VTSHRIYRTLDEAPSLWQSLEAEDIGIAALAFGIWNAVVDSLTGIRLVQILAIPILLGLWITTVLAWLKIKGRMPRHFLRDGVEYVRLPDGLDPGADLEAIPYVALSDAVDEQEVDEERWFEPGPLARGTVVAS
jgi:hypothetical protein